MGKKEAEKLFNLAYTDSTTGVYNRTAYEEKLAKLRKNSINLNNYIVVIVEFDNLKSVKEIYGNRMADDAIKTLARCLQQTLGTKTDVFRIGEDEFVCITERDILESVSDLRDMVRYENKEKIYPFSVSLGYSHFNSKSHKTIDDLILYCSVKMNNCRKRKK